MNFNHKALFPETDNIELLNHQVVTKRDLLNFGNLLLNEIKNSKTLQTAKEIGREIDGLVYTASRQPLSDADKRAIKELIDRELGLPTRMQKSFAVESASNDDLSDLADVIENILGGNK